MYSVPDHMASRFPRTEDTNGINIDIIYLTDDKADFRRLLVKPMFTDKVVERGPKSLSNQEAQRRAGHTWNIHN